MSSLLDRYQSLTTDSPVATKTSVLQAISNALPTSIDETARTAIVTGILHDLANPKNGKLTSDVTLPALVALKTLGRDPQASKIISQRENLATLHELAKTQSPEIAKEALRCVANALLLVEAGRPVWIEIGGGETCLSLLKRETSPDYIFLGARIIFVSTSQQTEFIVRAVEELGAVELVASKLDGLLSSIQSSLAMSKEAIVDVLKFSFNLLLLYPRMKHAINDEGGESKPRPVMGELWDEHLAPLLPSLLSLFNSLPQTSSCALAPPLTHVIHALLNIPIEPYSELWFPSSSSSTPISLKSDPMQKARQILSTGSASSSGTSTPAIPKDALQRAFDLLDTTLVHFIPGDPDDPSVRALARQEDVKLDDAVSPLTLLIARMVRDDNGARARMKSWVLPLDLDRSESLEKKNNFLGRCLRLMTSVYFPRLKDSTGEMLFCLCSSDPNVMAGQLGYGNCAGYLFNKGIMAPPKGSEDDMPDDPDINPITGAKQTPSNDDTLEAMSDEEKEREAEKLFVLLDRMERLGLAVNPIRKAQQEGRLEEAP